MNSYIFFIIIEFIKIKKWKFKGLLYMEKCVYIYYWIFIRLVSLFSVRVLLLVSDDYVF